MRIGVILLAHGSRDPAWGEALQALAGELQARDQGLAVGSAYLELQAPTLTAAIDRLLHACPGLNLVWVCPIFWAATGHVQRDIPALLARAQAEHPGVDFGLLPALSGLPGMLPFLSQTLSGLARELPPALHRA